MAEGAFCHICSYRRRMIRSICTYKLGDLFYAAGFSPTPLLQSLILPDDLVRDAKALYLRALMGPHFKAPPASGRHGATSWSFDSAHRSVKILTLAKDMGELTAGEQLDLVDKLMDQLEDRVARSGMLRELVKVAERSGVAAPELAELTEYARAAGM